MKSIFETSFYFLLFDKKISLVVQKNNQKK